MKKNILILLILALICPMISMSVNANGDLKENSWRYKDGVPIETPDENIEDDFDIHLMSSPTMAGIDVSAHQGYIDWDAVQNSIDYAIIRCGYGSDDTSQDDAQWYNNANACTRLGIPFGVYIYSYANTTAKAASEAKHVLRLINGYNLSFPIYFDMEDNVQGVLSASERGAIAKTFCDAIQAAGYEVGIYANKNWWENYLTDSVFSNNSWYKWVAQYNSTCTYSGSYTMWQYTSSGSVNGISGNVDMNYWYGEWRDINKKTAVDVGTDYYAYIFNTPAWKTVELGSSNNVQLMTEKWTANQRWFVHRNTDGSYIFKNADNNRCLDVANAGNANGTNVQTADYNGSDAQKWNIYAVGDKYVFSPKCAPGKVLDLYSGNTADGTNVQIYDENDTDAQFFTVYQVNPDIPVPVIKSNATNYKTDGTVSITWDKTGYTDHYTYYLAEYPKGYAYTTNTKNGTVTSPSVSFSGLTSGNYSCFVHSVSHLGTQGGQSNWASFKVYEDDYIPTKTVVKDNHIYALYDYDMSWTFANELCADFGGHLVTITSADEESLVENLINSGSKEAYWLGGTDITDFGKLTSTDKVFHWTTGEAFVYSNWKSGEPSATGENGTKEHFAEIRKSYGNKWNDVNNISKNSKGFILEIEIDDYAPVKTDTYNGHQYMIFDKNTTWSEAKVFCEQLGGHLVTIESSAENEYVKSLLKSGERAWYYIGGQKENGTWKWYNGGTATTISWADNASAWTGTNLMMYKSTGNCIGVDNAYYPESDISNMGFVCEIDSTSTPTPTPTPTQKPTTQPTATPTPMPTKEPVVQSFVVTQYDTYADILNDDSAEHSGTVIIAKYDNGVLKNLKTVDVTFAANEKRTFLYGNSGEHKVFVWSSLKGMVSLVK